VSAIATYLTQSGKRRIFRCHTCETHFSETRATVFFDLRTSEEKVMMALKMLLVRVDLAGIGFVLGVTEATVLAWLRRAAQQAEAINHHLLRHLPVTQVQLDEMWSFIGRKHARETDEAGESLPGGADGRQWVWGSFAPECRLMIAAVVGPRTRDTAKEVVAATKARVAGLPAFFSDGFTGYLAALIAAFHVVVTFAPTGKRGRPRKPVCAPHPDLIYGQLVKQKKHGKLLTLRRALHDTPAPHLGCSLLGPEQICHGGLRLDRFPLLERPEGVVDQAIQGHAARLRHDDFDGGLAGGRLLGEHIDDEKEQQLPFGAEHRVKAPSGGVKPLKGPEEAFNGVGGRGQPGTAHAADELGQLLVHAADPGGQAPLGRPCPQPRESAPHGALIPGLQHLFHHRLARVDLGVGREVLREPVRHALLVMKPAQDVFRCRHQVRIGRSPIREDHPRDFLELAQLPAHPATGPLPARGEEGRQHRQLGGHI